MDVERLEVKARQLTRHRARGDLRRAWLGAVELTGVDPTQPRWWVHRGYIADALGREDEVLRAMRQAMYLFRREGAPERAAAVSMWLLRKGIDADDARGARGPQRRALRRAS